MKDDIKKNCIKKIRELERGKLYWIQLKREWNVQEIMNKVQELCKETGLDVIITPEGIDFIDAPPGYEVKRTEEIVK